MRWFFRLGLCVVSVFQKFTHDKVITRCRNTNNGFAYVASPTGRAIHYSLFAQPYGPLRSVTTPKPLTVNA